MAKDSSTIDRLVVAAVILPAGQGQGSRGRLLEMVADNSQTFIQVLFIQVLFESCMSFRNPDTAISTVGEQFQGLVEVPVKLLLSFFLLLTCPFRFLLHYFDACWFNS